MENDIQKKADDPWGADLLNVKARGETFTKLVQSIDDSKVISIQAGFGRGKTFFRQAWATHLRSAGEVVIEIDAQLSDHAGDPVVTFIAALVEALGPKDESTGSKLKKSGLKWAAVGGRVVAGAVIGRAVDGVIEAAGEAAAGEDDTSATLETLVDGVGDGLSKVARQLIATQMKAEKARTEELPEQLDKLRFALTMKEGEDADAKAVREKRGGPDRVVILIDELDRCHPEYAIALLEAMKLVFDRKGYVFVLMVNATNLQKIADHRFGKASDDDEQYLEKFVDIRLSLGATDAVIGEATRALVLKNLDIVGVPFGHGPEFTVERAAEVAAQMAPLSGLSMRQIKRVLLKVEVALRCYRDVPLDLPLLVWLAFEGSWNSAMAKDADQLGKVLPRSSVPRAGSLGAMSWNPPQELRPIIIFGHKTWISEPRNGLVQMAPPAEPLNGVPLKHYRFKEVKDVAERFFNKSKGDRDSISDIVTEGIAAWYICEHQDILDQAHLVQAS